MENALSLMDRKHRQAAPQTELFFFFFALCGHNSASWFWEVLMDSPVCQLCYLQKPLGNKENTCLSVSLVGFQTGVTRGGDLLWIWQGQGR